MQVHSFDDPFLEGAGIRSGVSDGSDRWYLPGYADRGCGDAGGRKAPILRGDHEGDE